MVVWNKEHKQKILCIVEVPGGSASILIGNWELGILSATKNCSEMEGTGIRGSDLASIIAENKVLLNTHIISSKLKQLRRFMSLFLFFLFFFFFYRRECVLSVNVRSLRNFCCPSLKLCIFVYLSVWHKRPKEVLRGNQRKHLFFYEEKTPFF